MKKDDIKKEIYRRLYEEAEEMDRQHSYALILTHAIPKGCIDPKYTTWLRKIIAAVEATK